MDIRHLAIFVGLVLTIGSYWWGEVTVWIGAPLFFFGFILLWIDKD